MRNFSLKTKANSQRSDKVRTFYKRILFVGVIVLLLVFGKTILGPLVSFITTPVFSIRNYIETSSATVPTYFRERSELHARIQTLEQEIASQHGLKNTFAYIEKENEELRNLLGATDAPSVTAGVVARPPHTPYDTYIIDRGANDGIVTGAPVYYGSGMALGYIRAVYADHALVTLLSSSQVETTVYVFGPDIFTTAYGEGGGVLRLSIPQGITISEGDVVALPSLERAVVGTVHHIQSIPSEPEQHAYVTLEIPLAGIRMVSVSTQSYTPGTFDDVLRSVQQVRDTFFTLPIPLENIDNSGTSTGQQEVQI